MFKASMSILSLAMIVAPLSANAVYGGSSFSPSSSSYSSTGGTNMYLLGVSGMRMDHNDQFNGANVQQQEEINTYIDTKFGYVWSSGIYTGAIFTTGSFSYQGSGTTSVDHNEGYGVTLGYHVSGWYLDGTYLLNSTYTRSNGDSFSGGTNWFGELGYNMVVGGPLYLGVGVVYKSYAWNQQTISGTTTQQTNSETDLYPSLNLGFEF